MFFFFTRQPNGDLRSSEGIDEHSRWGICWPWSKSTEVCEGDVGTKSANPEISLSRWKGFSSEASGDSEWFPISTRDFLDPTCQWNSFDKLDFNSTNFLRLLSVTTHSTWSKRQFVHGEPFSTTSHRTLRARQQQQAFEARLLTGRLWPEIPAVEAFRFPDSVSVMLCYCVRGRMGDIRGIWRQDTEHVI